MLNKYLFPKMKEYEAAYAKQWNKDQEARLEQERTDQAVTYLTRLPDEPRCYCVAVPESVRW